MFMNHLSKTGHIDESLFCLREVKGSGVIEKKMESTGKEALAKDSLKVQIPRRIFRNKKITMVIWYQRIFVPGSTGFMGVRRDAVSPAARIMPFDSTPKILAGARFVTTTTSFPTRSSGL